MSDKIIEEGNVRFTMSLSEAKSLFGNMNNEKEEIKEVREYDKTLPEEMQDWQ